MGIIVQKFGGSSVKDVERIKEVAKIISDTYQQGNKVVVVVSAMGDYTDDMLSLASQLTTKPSPREIDMLLTTGEQVSISLLALAIEQIGNSVVSLTGWQAGITTESVHGKARILNIDSSRIKNELEQGKIVIVAGFQGITDNGEITTLGRGGSDTSAVALAAALDANRCEIYTDVDGVYTTDPRICLKARKLPEISYDEMLELANLGAVVLHPRAVETAKKHGVKLVVRSSYNGSSGTEIKEEEEMESLKIVTGIAYDKDVARIQVKGLNYQINTLSMLFTLLAAKNINVDMIVTSDYGLDEINVSFSTTKADLDETIEILNNKLMIGSKIIHDVELAKVSIVGAGMISNPGVAAKMFSLLSSNSIPIKMVSTSEIKVSCLIPKDFVNKAIEVLHDGFELDYIDIKGQSLNNVLK